jgi:hypothetical protein
LIFVRCFFSSPRLRFDSRIFLLSAGGLGDFLRRSFSCVAISAMRCRSRTLSIASSKRSRASLRFTACERESWTVTLMPVGRCRNVTAVETLFTFWPPGPLDRAKISRRSLSLISSFRIRLANVSCDILYHSTITSSFEKLSQFVFNARISAFHVLERTADGRTRTGTGRSRLNGFKSDWTPDLSANGRDDPSLANSAK